jgi:hypothetical protein
MDQLQEFMQEVVEVLLLMHLQHSVILNQQVEQGEEVQVEQEHLVVALELQILEEVEEVEVEVDQVEQVLHQDQQAVQES